MLQIMPRNQKQWRDAFLALLALPLILLVFPFVLLGLTLRAFLALLLALDD